MNHTLKSFTDQVLKMRLAQARYFETAAKARKTKHPDDHKTRATALEISKNLEREVDQAIKEIQAYTPQQETSEERTIAPETFSTISENPL